MALQIMSLRVPKSSENTPEQTAQLLASLARSTRNAGFLGKLLGSEPVSISLEVTLLNGQITFAIVCPSSLTTFVQSQLVATYPDVVISSMDDYLSSWASTPPYMALIRQSYASYFPLRDYADYKEVDPMLPLLGVLSKASENDKVLIQFVLSPAPSSVSKQAYNYLHPKPITDQATGKTHTPTPPEGKKIIEDKLSHPLVGVSMRFATSNPNLISDLTGAISVLNRPDGNSLGKGALLPWQKSKLWDRIRYRLPYASHFTPLSVLNVMELSSLWHLPGVYTRLPNVAWTQASAGSLSEAPENLPISTKNENNEPNQVANDEINFFAKTQYRNQEVNFGLKLEDRLRHVYILGKSGTGKSTLLENMAVDDFKKGRGCAFIDPHGDSAEALLDYIPANRINDVVYFNPADREYPLSLNVLDIDNPDTAELVASGIVSIFHKLYGHSWGPRLEYILRNTLLSLTYVPGTTLPDVVRTLTDTKFRQSLYPTLQSKNQQLINFWKNEYDVLDEKTRAEQIASILNKVGQFVNSPLIHKVISSPKTTLNLEDILNGKKILIANLSQGKLGEDNSALLGAMLITKLQLAAMARVDLPKDARPEFFLYVDEFQNFATESFVKILSEARKYRLGLVLANQYIAQIPETIQDAIFGNAGSIISFVLGADDARVLEHQYGSVFTEESLVSLAKHQIALKIAIDGQITTPFLAFTLPPLKSKNQNRDKVISASRQRYAIKSK